MHNILISSSDMNSYIDQDKNNKYCLQLSLNRNTEQMRNMKFQKTKGNLRT